MAPNSPTGQALRQWRKESINSLRATTSKAAPITIVCNRVEVTADMDARINTSPVASASVAARKLTVDRPRKAPAASPSKV